MKNNTIETEVKNDNIVDFLLDKEFERFNEVLKSLAFKKEEDSGESSKIQNPFISILQSNGIKKEISLTEAEIKVLRFAVLHNYGNINLRGEKDVIMSLMNKGLVKLTEDGDDLTVDNVVGLIIKQDRAMGCSRLILNQEIESVIANNDIAAFFWYLPNATENNNVSKLKNSTIILKVKQKIKKSA